jgi:hypothetical protein
MMQNKTPLILQNADSQAQFNGNTGLTFDDPFGVFLKNGEYLLILGNDLTFNHAPLYLIDLSFGMCNKPLYF